MTTDISQAGLDTGLWLRQPYPGSDDGVRLLCLPHAGGSATFYRPLAAALAPRVSAYAVQYPGRQDRRREPCIESIEELADALYAALREWLRTPVALFGHSMGATLAFELALRMERRDGRGPVALILSGRRAPSRFRADTVHLRDDDGILAELAALSGTEPALLADPDIRAMVLPALRGDYRAIETYRGGAADSVSSPILALAGEQDDRVATDDVAAWARHTTGEFGLRTYPGGHFFLNDHVPDIAELVVGQLATVSG